GLYAGHNPADGPEAIARVEAVRAKGADYLAFPGTAFWWLEFYAGLRAHLDAGYRRVHADDHCLLYDLGRGSAPDVAGFEGRDGWHFPQAAGGVYAGHYPVDSAAAVEHLEGLRARGAGYLVFPNTAFWWLVYYEGFLRHLDARYRRAHADERCVVYDLSP